MTVITSSSFRRLEDTHDLWGFNAQFPIFQFNGVVPMNLPLISIRAPGGSDEITTVSFEAAFRARDKKRHPAWRITNAKRNRGKSRDDRTIPPMQAALLA
jgi:hypothetical protein